MDMNMCSNVTVWTQAVADHHGAITFSVPIGTNSAWASVRDLGTDKSIRVDVPCLTIDSILERLPPVRFVKIDVEGAEQMVLSGMDALIRRDKPFIALELSDAWLRELGSSAQAVCDLLRNSGYSLHKIGTDGVTELHEAPRSQIDMLCVPSGQISSPA